MSIIYKCATNNYIATEVMHSLEDVIEHCTRRCTIEIGCNLAILILTRDQGYRKKCLEKSKELIDCLSKCIDVYRWRIAQKYNISAECVQLLWMAYVLG